MRKRIILKVLFRGILISICFLSNLLVNPIYAEQAEIGKEFVFELQYNRDNFYNSINLDFMPYYETFEKEPNFKVPVVRGLLPAGSQDKDQIPFIWDRKENKLYLDINRNNDLTDDGSFTSHSDDREYGFFNDIPFKFEADSVEIHSVITVILYDFNLSYSYFYIQTGFTGEIELYGKKWKIAIVDNLNGKINSDDQLYLLPGEMNLNLRYQQNPFYVPETIFSDGHNYSISSEILNKNDKPVLQLTLTESDYPKGEINIMGKSIRLLTLETDSGLVQLDSPEGRITVPAGEYSIKNVLLDAGSKGIFNAINYSIIDIKIIAGDKENNDLNIGAPLNNTTSVSRMGNVIALDYELLGSGGERYEKITQILTETPTVSVFSGDKKIATGKFEFG